MPFAHRPSLSLSWQAVVDFDGTISCDDTTDRVLQRFAEPGWEAIEAEWQAGLISSRACMTRQVALLRVSPEVLDTFVTTLEIDYGFPAFALLCQRHGIPLTIVSDGLDRTIRTIMRRTGFDHIPVIANRLEPTGGDRWRLTSPHSAPDGACSSGTCKCRVAAKQPRPLTLLFGDGRSDYCLAGEADLVLAKSGLAAHCRQARIPHHAVTDFAEAAACLEAVLAGAPLPHQPEDKING
ncbi:MtnX-like HAD-IB family phosphatase [Chelatococcus asaccharovorans]|uniref:MtnX-like HAD-IB family phosphatase n=1 Tax=Chelatococcus asaccharovorans TaxID=28210 RepID=UPI00224C6684|nr:MtnX-like HAD-IB family phosphatase [Chelatococcus asaccharovorans]CAH1660615.1 HAD superfamily phosphoserine phosphatase-like hydrolase/2,3-diketo-5-methylthio-1-phosphopentane phosphatase [Chelatococcus asaccharovorans]CAH1683735.1 HAD superfamily phosphoserine phosphatase-like hydrolase/2,3-diketo-5-methylthio-1-phosphopentane phosphatase [Chelatococcus asaccharovorans]